MCLFFRALKKARLMPIAIVITGFTWGAQAMPMTPTPPVELIHFGFTLYGAKNVPVGGSLYTVMFDATTCKSAYSGCDSASDFPFSTFDEAKAAAQALLDHVFIDIGTELTELFDTRPNNTRGCSGVDVCVAYVPFGTPYQVDIAGTMAAFIARSINYRPSSGTDFVADLLSVVNNNYSTAHDTRVTMAIFTKQVVPEPATLAIFSFALVGLGYARRRAA